MTKFVIRRLLLCIVILFFVMFIIYLIMRCLPTSYIQQVARELSNKPGGTLSYAEILAKLNVQYGMDKDVVSGYFFWLGTAVKGDFGNSWQYTVPVTQKFNEVIWLSFVMGAISFILEMIIAVPLGVMAARKQYGVADYTITIIALIGISLPSFFTATLFKYVFAMKLNWFETIGLVSRFHEQMTPIDKFFDKAWHLVLPITNLVILSIGGMMRYTRTNMLEVLNADYIRTARAKGLPEKRVINYHAFRNTLIPIVTIVGGSLPGLFAGAMITETLFAIPGIGYTSFTAMMAGDIPFTMFYLSFMAVLTLLGTLMADILYAVVDPRVRVN